MSKGSNVTGTGCLMKLNFFCVLASWQMKGNDFGLSSGTLAIVDSDRRTYILANPAGWGRCFSTISCLSWLACSIDMLNMICTIRKVLSY